jgi:hypothetical protein
MAVPPLRRTLPNKKPPAARPRAITVSVHCAPKAQPNRIVHPWRTRSASEASVYAHCPRSFAHHPPLCKKGLPALARSPPECRRIQAPLPLWLSFGSTQRGVSDPAASGEALIRPLLSRPLASLDVSGQRRLFACTPRLTRCGSRSRRQHTPAKRGSQRPIGTNAAKTRITPCLVSQRRGAEWRCPQYPDAGSPFSQPASRVRVSALRRATRWVWPRL